MLVAMTNRYIVQHNFFIPSTSVLGSLSGRGNRLHYYLPLLNLAVCQQAFSSVLRSKTENYT